MKAMSARLSKKATTARIDESKASSVYEAERQSGRLGSD
jgi:hypothetical protein